MKLRTSIIALMFAAGTSVAHAQGVTLTMAAGQPGNVADASAKHIAEIAAEKDIATIQLQSGQVLTRTLLQVAQGSTDLTGAPLALAFLMSRGLGPYGPLGKDDGAKTAENLRVLVPFHMATYYLRTFATTGIKSWDDLNGKIVHNGPPGGGALVMARQLLQAVGGLKETESYRGVQIDWGQQNTIFLDGSVDASVLPGTNPDANMPMLVAAGKINLISVPKDVFEGEAFQRLAKTPGRVPVVQDVSDYDHYGDDVTIVSEDDKFRTAGEAGAIFANKNLSREMAKKLTAAFIETLPNLYQKVPFAKGQKVGTIDEDAMRLCGAGVKFHEGAVEAWEEAGYTVADCQKP